MAQKQSRSGGVDLKADRIDIGGDVVGRDKIVQNIQNIQQRALTAAEEAEQAKSLEAQRLAQGVSAFAQRLQARASDTTDADKGGPYKGLLEYRLSDAEIFFGRARAIRELFEHLQRGPLTVLHAESGAGKTSLLQAGISPRLIAAGRLPVHLRPYNVGPSLALKRAFLPNLNDTPDLAQASPRDFLSRVSDVLGAQTTLYIFLDQFEEFFTRLEEPDRAEFVRGLAECLDDENLNARWVLSLRSEYFGELANFRPRVRNPFENDYRLNRLTHAEAREAVAEPAARHDITFEDGLIDTVLNDLGADEVAPPQVQLVCSTLYEALPPAAKVITREHYEDQGGAAGILRGHLGRVLKRDLPAEQRPIAQRLLEELITSDIRRVIRTRAELAIELAPQGAQAETLDPILSQLVDSRLLRAEEIDGQLAYELAHDYLLDEIKLDPAVQARKAAQELLEQEVRAYKRHGTLLSDDKLAIIEARRGELALSDDATTLLHRSERALKRKRGLLLSGAGVVFILILLAVSSVVTTVGAVRTQNVVLTREAIANQAIRRAFEKSGIVPVGHEPVALASDGTRLWVANAGDNTVQSIDLATGEAGTPIAVGHRPNALVFDGTRLWVAIGDGAVQAIDAATGEVGKPISVGRAPGALVFDGTQLWVANSGGDTVQAIDPVTGEVGMPIAVGSRPGALVFDGTRLWVANWGDDTVQAIDPTTGEVGKPIAVGGTPRALVFDGTRLWIANWGDDALQAIDPATGKVGKPIAVGNWPGALAFDGTRLWVANGYDGTLQAIDPATGEAGAPIEVGRNPSALAFDMLRARLWVADGAGSIVRAIDPTTGDVGRPIAVGRAPSALVFDGARLWVANWGDGTVQAIDPAASEVSAPIAVGRAPSALVFDGVRVWVANTHDNTVQAIDPATGEVGALIRVGNAPSALAFDVLRARLWVANASDDTVQAIDPATGDVGAPIAVGDNPSALVFDTLRSRLWVANAFDDTVQAIDPATGDVGAPIGVDELPSALAFDGTRLWVANRESGTVQTIDPATSEVGARILFGLFPTPSALIFDGTGLWVANLTDGTVQTIDPATGEMDAPIAVGADPSALAFDTLRAWLWVANAGDNTVQYIVVHKRVNE